MYNVDNLSAQTQTLSVEVNNFKLIRSWLHQLLRTKQCEERSIQKSPARGKGSDRFIHDA